MAKGSQKLTKEDELLLQVGFYALRGGFSLNYSLHQTCIDLLMSAKICYQNYHSNGAVDL